MYELGPGCFVAAIGTFYYMAIFVISYVAIIVDIQPPYLYLYNIVLYTDTLCCFERLPANYWCSCLFELMSMVRSVQWRIHKLYNNDQSGCGMPRLQLLLSHDITQMHKTPSLLITQVFVHPLMVHLSDICQHVEKIIINYVWVTYYGFSINMKYKHEHDWHKMRSLSEIWYPPMIVLIWKYCDYKRK